MAIVQTGQIEEQADVGTEEVSPIESDSTQETTPTEETNNGKEESVRDTVIRSLKELQAGNDNGDKEESSEESETKVVRGKDGKFAKPTLQAETPLTDPEDPELLPPERLKPEAKKLFQNLPVGIKKELHRTVKDLEAGFTRTQQELARERESVRGVHEAIQPYLSKWGASGHSATSAIAALASAQEKLTNPETSLQTYYGLGKDLGIPEDVLTVLGNHIQGGGQKPAPATIDLDQHPKFQELQGKYDHVQSYIRQQEMAPVVQELTAVQQEIDPASGKLKYPELQDDDYFQSLRPRVLELVEIEPGKTIADHLRQAADEKKAKLFPSYFSQAQTQTRPPVAINNRARSAAISVRGRSSPSISPIHGSEPPSDALKDSKATVAWALQQLRRGA
ncbi:hypothetical protein UFOVP1365_16 [uncultured Caudovirales phage]|uniref:Uncharacterized protein n=1 Tax=uncultured Caudovirales phage TaxID=2100421 RepID=A0A6J5S445_9CAUD|nr:hypothetical protein UFOVP1365_16 [uncultured Caudovirales phage]